VLPRTGKAGESVSVAGTGSGSGSDLGAGSANTVQVPVGTAQRGWEVAHWAMAHATELRLTEVSYAGRTWRVTSSRSGWATGAAGAASAAEVRITTTP
jgi:hypothetical protein